MRPHKKLLAWQSAIDLIDYIYRVTMGFPTTEKFGLISQLRRAAVSVASNIAEGAARNSKKEFIQFNYYALASTSEIDTLAVVSKNLNLLNEAQYEILTRKNEKTFALIHGLNISLKASIYKNKTTEP